MKRILFLSDKTGQFWHRGFLPVRNCAPFLVGAQLDISTQLMPGYDAYVIQRRPPFHPQALADMKNTGKKLIWSLDDDLWNVPQWNPAHKTYEDTTFADWFRDYADEVWVSTEELRKRVGRGVVLPNLIDRSYWPSYPRPRNDPLRIIWAGSAFHAPDVELVAGVFDRLLTRYSDVLCLFFGSYPESLSEWVRVPGSNTAVMVPAARFAGRLGYVEPVEISRYPSTLVTLNPDIALAALVDEPFARSKSNLKWLEYSMTGASVVASDFPPYRGCVALIGDLYENCCKLIEDEGLRRKLGQQAQEEVLGEWLWTGSKRELWLEAIRNAVSWCTI